MRRAGRSYLLAQSRPSEDRAAKESHAHFAFWGDHGNSRFKLVDAIDGGFVASEAVSAIANSSTMKERKCHLSMTVLQPPTTANQGSEFWVRLDVTGDMPVDVFGYVTHLEAELKVANTETNMARHEAQRPHGVSKAAPLDGRLRTRRLTG